MNHFRNYLTSKKTSYDNYKKKITLIEGQISQLIPDEKNDDSESTLFMRFYEENKTKGIDNALKLFHSTSNALAGIKHFITDDDADYIRLSNRLVDSIGTLIAMELNNNISLLVQNELLGNAIPSTTKKILINSNARASILLDRVEKYYKSEDTKSFINQLRNKIKNSNAKCQTSFLGRIFKGL